MIVGEDIHVIPVGDLREHDLSRRCWCKPEEDSEEPAVVVHNSLDGREKHEAGAPLH